MANSAGHEVIRLPPYHSDNNPIELIWAQMKGYVARHNTTYRLDDVLRLMNESVNSISKEKWQTCCRHVIDIEQEAWERDNNIDRIMDDIDSIIISTSDSEYSSDEGEASFVSLLSETDVQERQLLSGMTKHYEESSM